VAEKNNPLAFVVLGKVHRAWVVTALKAGALSPIRGMPAGCSAFRPWCKSLNYGDFLMIIVINPINNIKVLIDTSYINSFCIPSPAKTKRYNFGPLHWTK
jgi:hypothetical protein